MNFIKTIIDSTKQTWVGSKILYNQSKQVKSFIRNNPDASKWTRSDYLMIHRVRADVKKSAAFGLIFLLLPEVIPLILARGINVLPSVFLTNDQKINLKQKLAQERLDIAKKYVSGLPKDLNSHAKVEPQHYIASSFNRSELKDFAKLFDLGRLGTRSMITKRINRHVGFLKKDDDYLKGINLEDLTQEELESALNDRGISRYDRSDSECIAILKKWLEQETSIGTDTIVKVKTSMILNNPRN